MTLKLEAQWQFPSENLHSEASRWQSAAGWLLRSVILGSRGEKMNSMMKRTAEYKFEINQNFFLGGG